MDLLNNGDVNTDKLILNHIYCGNSLDVLRSLPDESINCCITSPPYYGLRDYGTGKWIGGDPNCPHRRMSKYSPNTITGHAQAELRGNVGDAIYKSICPLCGAIREDEQIGLEETPSDYIKRLVGVFHEVKRVLKDDGTLWVNIGDTYAAQRGGIHQPAETLADGKHGFTDDGDTVNRGRERGYNPTRNASAIGLKHKDMIGIPWMLAFALREDGWYLRQDIIWHKTNPMPESVKDRCTKSHEYIFLLSKSPKYYFDNESIKEPAKTFDSNIRDRDKSKLNNTPGRTKMGGLKTNNYTKRNKRDVWTISTKPFKGAHFAVFPEELITPCILAGCPEGGVVLDPFFGSGTTGCVAAKLDRNFVGIELNPNYINIAEQRLINEQLINKGQ